MDIVEIEKIKLRATYLNGIAVSLAATGAFGGIALAMIFLADSIFPGLFQGVYPTSGALIAVGSKAAILISLIALSLVTSRDLHRDARSTLERLGAPKPPGGAT